MVASDLLSRRIRRFRSFGGLALVLLVFAALTWAGGTLHRQYARAHVEERQQTTAERTAQLVLRDVEQRLGVLRDLGVDVAEASEVQAGLRTNLASSAEHALVALDAAAEYAGTYDLPERTALEVYDAAGRLLVWNGYSFPLSPRERERLPAAAAFAAASVDEDRRAALAWWQPVVDDEGHLLGAVRTLHLIQFDAPVQNRYLSDYALTDRWRRAAGLPVALVLGQEVLVEEPGRLYRNVRAPDGSMLGTVVVQLPQPSEVLSRLRDRYDDVLVFWLVVLAGWLFGALWRWYRAAEQQLTPSPRLSAEGRFLAVGGMWFGLRYLLLALDVPARWLGKPGPLAPLFDPAHLASSLGGGLLRSTGDLLLTALFALAFAFAFLQLAAPYRQRVVRLSKRREGEGASSGEGIVWHVGLGALFGTAVTGLVLALALVVRRAVLDSTLDYFARQGLLPEPLVLFVLAALLLLTTAVAVTSVALAWRALHALARHRPAGWSDVHAGLALATGAGAVLLTLHLLTPLGAAVPWFVAVAFVGAAAGIAWSGVRHRARPSLATLLALRNILPALFLLTLLLYPVLYGALDALRRTQMTYALEAFDDRRDPRVLFAVEQVLREAREKASHGLREAEALEGPETQAYLDSLADELLRGALLSSLTLYDVSLGFYDAGGRELARATEEVAQLADDAGPDSLEFETLRRLFDEHGGTGTVVEQVPAQHARFQYVGMARTLVAGPGDRPLWILVRAEPQTLLHDAGEPLPRILLPAGLTSSASTDFALAEYQDGRLVRNYGRHTWPYALQPRLLRSVEAAGGQGRWRIEERGGERFLTFYRPYALADLLEGGLTERGIVAVRVATLTPFDHLYYLLRLTVAGLAVAVPLILLGFVLQVQRRRRSGVSRARFRNRVVDAFLVVGIVMVGVMGVVGLEVVTEQNERAVRARLRQYLERVEASLRLRAEPDEEAYEVFERIGVDTLATLVGLDLNVYEGRRLVASSRPQLLRERFLDERLPMGVYDALFLEGDRIAYATEHVGSFRYATAYRILLDEEGSPRYVVAVPTLPEQERIAEEQARTVAYLFGALLLLAVVLLATAGLLAGALARPLAQLRRGLQGVAEGDFERPLPVPSRDEVGQLVETFNQMQAKLAESRERLAQQERQLAWREMARQVAHEIKNPLTPMKLSVQHLRRAFERERGAASEKFQGLFDRITTTLVEQTDALARIANEFHTFARMPRRALDLVDLNEIAQEAVALMQESAEHEDAVVEARLHPEPLPLRADHEELRRVYINLIKNALQAMPPERAPRVVVTTKEAEGRRAYSTVEDNGSGIPKALQDKIFQPNFSTKTSGTGLGLAITAKAVQDLGGVVGFETEEGLGTTFWLRIPLAGEDEA